jgi:2-polyprenyl-3-methyl-5-hydroxy-6-metoxy-1,4-benzoquinol methylase
MNAKAAPASSDDWNRHWGSFAESNALNPAQAYRRMLIFRALGLSAANSTQTRLLEVGCGQGELSSELMERHPDLQ